MRLVRDDRAQALVETALSLTILTLMMLGAVEFGSMAVAATEVSNAAKVAAQYAAQSHSTASDLTGIQNAAKNEYHNPAGLTLVSPTSTSGYTCTCAGTGSSTSCTNNSTTSPSCSGGYTEVMVTVTTQVTYTPMVHLPGLPSTFQLQGKAQQKVLQ